MNWRPILFSGPMVRAIIDGRKTVTRRIIRSQPPACAACHRDRHWYLDAMDGLSSTCECGSYQTPHRENAGWVDADEQFCRLWVRETWQYADWTEDGMPWVRYRADGSERLCENIPEEWAERLTDEWAGLSLPANYDIDNRAADRKWRPSIFMPRWASRLSLEVTEVRVERLQEITEEEAIAEGAVRGRTSDLCESGYEWIVEEQPPRGALNIKNASGQSITGSAGTAFRWTWDSINAKRAGGIYRWEANPWVWVVRFRRLP